MKTAEKFLEEQNINQDHWIEDMSGRPLKVKNLLTLFLNQQLRTITLHRCSITGRLVKKAYADANPDTTVKETRLILDTK